jgi:hypothetical protein
MGERGPAPRREEERRRTNEPVTPVTKLSAEQLASLPFEIDLTPAQPSPEAGWNELVRDLWDALAVDPARKWMTAADWAATKIVLDILSTALGATDSEGNVIPVSGNVQTAFLKHLATIGVTEQARLRIGKEITLFAVRPVPNDDDNVTDISTAREAAVQ